MAERERKGIWGDGEEGVEEGVDMVGVEVGRWGDGGWWGEGCVVGGERILTVALMLV